AKAELRPVADVTPRTGFTIKKALDIPQTIIRVSVPGPRREDPDFLAAYVMNHILGGGSFSSWLYEEVREKRGLAYS
ncbi:insulinase family protein, partial [Mycobacterium tuberculosis]|nr:insulinase family protein [Mycobacterium tuberculosis]